MSELNLILLGPPGAGKGTQGKRLVDDFRLPYIVTGDMVRQAVKDGTELGKQFEAYNERGDLVPDELVIAMITQRLEDDDCADGYILDGFPRSIPQADALDTFMQERGRSVTAVLLIEAPDEEVVRRISGRRCCVKAGHVYNIHFDPPKNEGFCDQDGSRLAQRDDDAPDKVEHRLAVYHDSTKPLIPYYEERALLRRFDGSRSPTEVHDHIRATLATLRLEEKL